MCPFARCSRRAVVRGNYLHLCSSCWRLLRSLVSHTNLITHWRCSPSPLYSKRRDLLTGSVGFEPEQERNAIDREREIRKDADNLNSVRLHWIHCIVPTPSFYFCFFLQKSFFLKSTIHERIYACHLVTLSFFKICECKFRIRAGFVFLSFTWMVLTGVSSHHITSIFFVT